MTQEIQNLIDAYNILCRAYSNTTGMGEAHKKVWRAIEYLQKQSDALIAAQLEAVQP